MLEGRRESKGGEKRRDTGGVPKFFRLQKTLHSRRRAYMRKKEKRRREEKVRIWGREGGGKRRDLVLQHGEDQSPWGLL